MATIVLGSEARAEDLVRAGFEDLGALMERASETVWDSSCELEAPWTPYPAEPPG